MNVAELIFRANTNDLDKAERKLDQVEKKATAAEKSAGKLTDAFDNFSSLGGPIGDVADSINGMKDRIDSAIKSVTAFAANAGLAVGALTALAGAAGVIASLRFVGVLDDLDDLAQKMGLNASQTLLMKQELEDAGVSLEAYDSAINRASKALSKADDEGKAAAEALQTLGVNAKEATTPQELLNRLTADYGKKLEEGKVTVHEAAALQLVLGKNYKESMIAVQAAQSAQERYNTFAAAGISISTSGIDATRNYSSANKDLQYVFQSVGSKLIGEVIPAFTGLVNALVDSYKNGGLVRVAFDGIRVATQLVMVPVRAMFNAFIQLDAAIQTVGKGIGAVFAAIATRSSEPLKAFKKEVEEIWKLANSRTTGPWSWDNGETQAAQKGNLPTAGGSSAKAGNGTAFEDTDEYRRAMKEAQERSRAKNAEYEGIEDYFKDQYIKQIEATHKQIEELNRLRDSYLNLIDPLEKFKKQLEEVRMLREKGLLTSEQATAAEIELQKRMQDALNKTKGKAEESFNFMERVGQSAFKRLEDTIVSFAEQGKFSFSALITSIISDLIRMYVQMTIIKPLMDGFKSFLNGGSFLDSFISTASGTKSADGNVFGPSGLLKSAKGNVFDGPVLHAYNGGIGVLGEAGPEAVMPLKRGADGVLGVQVQGGSASSAVTIGGIYVTVEGGNTAEQTGEAIGNAAAVALMQKIADARIANAMRYGGALNR